LAPTVESRTSVTCAAGMQAKKPHMATLALVVAAAETEEASMRPVLANLYAADSVGAFGAAVAKAAPQ